jgi:hypothetical protein
VTKELYLIKIIVRSIVWKISKENEGVSHSKQRKEQVQVSKNVFDMFKEQDEYQWGWNQVRECQQMMGISHMLCLLWVYEECLS